MKKNEEDFRELWKALPKELQDELAQAVRESSAETPEDFVWEIFVGECPQCGSKDTRDCEEVPGIEDITLGFCNKCGHLWCSECGRPVAKGTTCEHWEICKTCSSKKDTFGDCGMVPWECEKVSVFKEPEGDETVYTCAWCDREIEKDAEVFGLGARTRGKMSLKDQEGSTIRIPLTHGGRTVPAIVPARGSEARKAGNDILFMICSKQCGELLKKALLKEKFKVICKD